MAHCAHSIILSGIVTLSWKQPRPPALNCCRMFRFRSLKVTFLVAVTFIWGGFLNCLPCPANPLSCDSQGLGGIVSGSILFMNEAFAFHINENSPPLLLPFSFPSMVCSHNVVWAMCINLATSQLFRWSDSFSFPRGHVRACRPLNVLTLTGSSLRFGNPTGPRVVYFTLSLSHYLIVRVIKLQGSSI